MELTDYLTTLRRRWKLVVALVVAFVAVGVALTAVATPQYAATAQIFVSTTPTDTSAAYQGNLFAAQRVASYADLIDSRPLAETVSGQLGGSPAPETLIREVSATVVTNEVILTITATDPDPALARQIAVTYAKALSSLVYQLETPQTTKTGVAAAPFVRTSIVDKSALPTHPVSPRPLLNIAIALILGLLAGVGAAVLRQRLDRTITSQADVKDITTAPILGHIQLDNAAIRKAPTAALRETTGWAEAFRVLRTNMQYVEVDRDQKVFVVSSSLQGEGKSTTAVNLAVTLAMAETRVVLVECDLRRPTIAAKLGLDEAVGTTNVLVGKVALQDALQEYAPTQLMALAAGPLPPNPSELLQSHAMDKLPVDLRSQFDVVILDAPPMLPVTDAALLAARSDGAVVVVRHGKPPATNSTTPSAAWNRWTPKPSASSST